MTKGMEDGQGDGETQERRRKMTKKMLEKCKDCRAGAFSRICGDGGLF